MSNDRRSSGAAGDEVHVAAHRPQEILAAAEQHVFGAVEHALLDQLLGLAHPVDVFRDPEQRMQVAQPALAVLDVGLDQVAGLAGAAVALLALGELGGDEFRRGALRHVLVEARHHLVVQPAVAEQKARLEHGGADGDVGLGLPDAFVDRARRVADLEAHVPQAIEDRLGDRLAPRGLLVGQQEQQIDVGARRQQSAPVAAGRDHRHLLGFRRVMRRIEMLRGELEQQPDDLVLHVAEPLGAAAAVTIRQQQLLGGGAPLQQRRLQALGERRPQLALIAGVLLAELVEVGGERVHVEQVGGRVWSLFGGGCEHGQRGDSGAGGDCHPPPPRITERARKSKPVQLFRRCRRGAECLGAQSTLRLASRITLAHFLVSAAMKSLNCSGDVVITS